MITTGRQSTDTRRDDRCAEGPEALRTAVHSGWAAVAASWAEHVDYADARGATAAARMLAITDPQPGERVLELACGPAGLGLAAAKVVAPGEVVLSDVVPEMTSIGAARAEALGLTNVRTRVLDLEEIAEPDGSYDVVLVREGLMFAVDPARAAREIHRVLRPGGRVAIAVWGPREANPWLGLVFDAVSAQLGKTLPPAGMPGPFALSDSRDLVRLLADAGLAEVQVNELAAPVLASSFDEWWTRTAALAGPLSRLLAALPESAIRALRGRLERAIIPYRTPDGLELPGIALLASARRN